ncbi:Septum site-determining protein MinD [Anaerolineales bacterium]|nr:Septum site-determining protein MinD [Anaerolineales bacterium]
MPPSSISLIIIDSDRYSRNAIEDHLKLFGNKVALLGSVGDLQDGLRLIVDSNPTIVILEVKELEKGVDTIRSILSRFPRTSIFVTAAEKNPDWILKLLRAGAVEYLVKPVEKIELLEALQKAGRLWESRQSEDAPSGKIITVYNPIGGMGTTTVAVNVAAALAAKNEKVALVDLNLFSGDVATCLDVTPRYTLSSVTSNIARLDASFLMSVMTRHSSGVYVLTEPLEVEDTAGITPEQVNRVLGFLKGVFSYIVIDTGGPLFGCNLATFKNSDHILFTTVLSLPALKNAKRYLAAMDKQGLTRDKITVVVNRYLPKADIRVEDASKVLDWKVFITVPNEYADVVSSINRGVPIVKLSPRSTVSMAIVRLAEILK